MDTLIKGFAAVAGVLIIVVLAIYVAQAIFLNKFNKLVNGKGTALAWIPICNVYLLGKLAINKIVGWVLVGCIFLTSTFSVTVNGKTTETTLLPENIRSVVSAGYSIAVFGLFIYAIIKYVNLKKKPKILPQQPVEQAQNPVIQQQIQQNTIGEQPVQSVTSNAMNNPGVQPIQQIQPAAASQSVDQNINDRQ